MVEKQEQISQEVFRINRLSNGFYLLCELDVSTLDLCVRLLSDSFREIKVLDDIPSDTLLEYAQLQHELGIWLTGSDTEAGFPIPIDEESIRLYDNLSKSPEELESEIQDDPDYQL